MNNKLWGVPNPLEHRRPLVAILSASQGAGLERGHVHMMPFHLFHPGADSAVVQQSAAQAENVA